MKNRFGVVVGLLLLFVTAGCRLTGLDLKVQESVLGTGVSSNAVPAVPVLIP